jgi:hypothetical protein
MPLQPNLYTHCHNLTRAGCYSTCIKHLFLNIRFDYQYIETNVMHSLFNLLRIKGLYMFRALLAHPQEAKHKRHLVYCMRVMSAGCTRIGVEISDKEARRMS